MHGQRDINNNTTSYKMQRKNMKRERDGKINNGLPSTNARSFAFDLPSSLRAATTRVSHARPVISPHRRKSRRVDRTH